MRITNELKIQTDKVISLLKEGRTETAIEVAQQLRRELEKVEVFARPKFERNEVIRERSTGYMVKVIGLGHSGDAWGYKVTYLNPEHEPSGEYKKPEWRYESEFDKAGRKGDEIKVDTSSIYSSLINRLKRETGDADFSLQDAIGG